MVKKNQPFIRKIHSTNDDVGNWIDESGKSDIWTFSTDVVGQGHRKSGQLCLVHVRPDRQTVDSFFSEILDRIRTADRFETDKIRAERHRTVFFTLIRTELRHRTASSAAGQDFQQKISLNLDIIKRYLRKQDFVETRFLSETSWYGRLKLEILIEITKSSI